MFYSYIDPLNVLFHVVGWILVIWFIVWLIRGARRHHHMWCDGHHCDHPMHMHGNRALELLKERYAKGEINKEEFEEKRATLTQ